MGRSEKSFVPDEGFGDLWRVAAEASEDAVFGLDADGFVISWTTGAARLFGYSESEILGKPTTLLVPDHQSGPHEALVRRALAGERIDRRQLDARRGDGMIVPVAMTLLPLAAGQGSCVIARDLTEQRVAQATLAESELRLREAQELSHVGLWLWDATGDVLQLSDESYRTHGIDPMGFDGTMAAYLDMVHPDDRADLTAAFERGLLDGATFEREYRIIRPTSELRWVYARAAVERDQAGVAVGLRGICQDISDGQRAAEALRQQASLLELLGQIAVAANEASTPEAALHACIKDVCLHSGWEVGHVHFVAEERSATNAVWFSADAARFEPFREAMAGTAGAAMSSHLTAALDTAGPSWTTDLAADTASPVAAPAVAAGLASAFAFPLLVGSDVIAVLEFFSSVRTQPDAQLIGTIWNGVHQLGRVVERTRARAELSHRALHDPLTGLPNRTLLLDRLAHSLQQRAPHPSYIALISIDLDDFKLINDSLGHEAGDRLLITFADRLRRGIRSGDTAARFGGDEFVVVCDRLTSEAVAVQTTERILAALAEPVSLQGEVGTVVTASAGLTVELRTDAVPDVLLRDADAALYRAKHAGRGHYQIFDSAMHRRATERLAVANELRSAIRDGELRLLYQPQVTIREGRMVGVEALVRWQHPKRGLVGPLEFISVAEETQLIVPLGGWVIREACRQAAAWGRLRPSAPSLTMCVNVSVKQLGRQDLVEDVAGALAETGIDPGSLCLEITESVLMTDSDLFLASLLQLRLLGVDISIDDFGTGYSSLAYLRRYPIDVIKVDKGFVDGIGQDDLRADAVVAAVVDLAHALGLVAVAEGVETLAQLRVLERLRCDAAQGFYFARPLPAEVITELVAATPEHVHFP